MANAQLANSLATGGSIHCIQLFSKYLIHYYMPAPTCQSCFISSFQLPSFICFAMAYLLMIPFLPHLADFPVLTC
jgi:hypothetical protein